MTRAVRSHYLPLGAVITVRTCEPTEIWEIVRQDRHGYYVRPVGMRKCGEMLVSRNDADLYVDPQPTECSICRQCHGREIYHECE